MSEQSEKAVSRGGRRKPPRRVSSLALLGNRGAVVIEHAGEEYHLRRTRNGKLILTK